MSTMNDIPDVALNNILSYITPQSFLPICHVSKRFRLVWIEMHTNNSHTDDTTRTHTHTHTHTSTITIAYETNPLSIGNLFESSWFFNNYNHENTNNSNGLNTTLLTYYIHNGFGSLVLKNYNTINNNDDNNNNSNNSNNNNININNDDAERGKKMLKKVMLQTASRGDIHGMNYMSINGYFPLNDEEICTTAGAAGKLEALKWLRGEGQSEGEGKVTTNEDMNCGDNKNKICCPWNPTEVHREAAENSHEDIMDYVEKNCKNHEIQMHYGVGLPW